MADFEVHIDLNGRTRPIGFVRTNCVRGAETILFEYDGAWLGRSGPVLAGACACPDQRCVRPRGGARDVRLDWRFRAGHLGAGRAYAAVSLPPNPQARTGKGSRTSFTLRFFEPPLTSAGLL